MLIALVACSPPDPPVIAPGTPLDQLPPPAVCSPGEVARFGGVAYPDIQAALDAAAGGGTVTICTGVHYASNLTYAAPGPIRIAGETGDPDDVILDGTFSGQIMSFGNYHSNVIVSGITFTHAGDLTYTMVDLEALSQRSSDGTFILEDSKFEDNRSKYQSTFHISSKIMIIRNVSIINNNQDGGPISTLFTSWSGSPYISIENVDFSGNSFSESGLSIILGWPTVPSRLQIRDVHFQDNRSWRGGALNISVYNGSSRVTVERATFVDNRSEGDTAGLNLTLQGPNSLDFGVSDSLFEDNTAVLGSLYAGSALFADGLHPRALPPNTRYDAMIHNTTFRRNTKRPGAFGTVWLNDRFRTQWVDVDFGTGADANFPSDISECATTSLGAGVRGRTDGFRGDNCP